MLNIEPSLIAVDLTDSGHFMWFAIAGLLGGIIRGYSGFGGPAVILLLLSHGFSPASLVFKVVLIDAMANLHLLRSALKEAEWRTVALLGIPAILGIPIGIYGLHHIDGESIRQAIGVTTAAAMIWLLSGHRRQKPFKSIVIVAVGFLNGIIYGASCIVLIAVAFLLLGPDSNKTSRANIIVWAFAMVSTYIPLNFALGYGAESAWPQILTLGLIYAGGALVGARLFAQSADTGYRKISIALLIILAGIAIFA